VFGIGDTRMIKKLLTHWTIAFITLIVITYIGLQDPQIKEILRLKSFDLLLQSEQKEISTDIHVVSIDEKAIEKYGQWPWNRNVLADVIVQLREKGAGTIVIPILFSEYDRLGGDDALVNTMYQNGVVIAQTGTNQINKNAVPRGVAKIGDPIPWLFEWGGMLGPIKEFGQYADGVGVTNTAPEVDGVVRRIPLLMRIGQEAYPAIALETIRVAVGDPSYQVKAGEGGIIAVRVPGFDTIKTDPNARIWLRWNKSYLTTSIADLENEEITLEGKTVIIGMNAEGLGGIIATPVGERYAYELTASTLSTVLDGKNIERVDISFIVELLSSFLIGALIIVFARYLPYWATGIILLSSYYIVYAGVKYFFQEKLMLVDGSWVIITMTIVGFHAVFNRFILEFRLKQQIRKQFETYLDPRQVAALQKDPSKLRLGGDRREMSFLFMDIIGFTPISEFYKNKDDPEGLVKLVNEFLDDMTKILLNNGAMIDKFMGDCIMAVFNAPIDMDNHAEMAVKSAMEIEAKTKELRALYKERGLPDINVGTGVNTGTAIIGNMGSSIRFDFSVIGDAVNLAARLEATAGRGKFKDCPTLYSSYTMEQLKTIKSIEVDKINVKGKEELITIYKPVV
jgi:adenylate cyclase